MSQVPPVARDWKKLVEESNGKYVFAPDALLEASKAWNDKRKEFALLINSIAKHEVEMKNMLENLAYKIREHFSAARPEIWSGEVGFNLEALREGQFVIEITKEQNA